MRLCQPPCATIALHTSCAKATPSHDTSKEGSVALRPYQAENVASILSALSVKQPGNVGVASFRASDAVGACGNIGFTTPPSLLYVLPTGAGQALLHR